LVLILFGLVPFAVAGLIVRSAVRLGPREQPAAGISGFRRLVRSFRFWSGGLQAAVLYLNFVVWLLVMGLWAKDHGRPIRAACDYYDMSGTAWVELGVAALALVIGVIGVRAWLRWGRKRTMLAHTLALGGLLYLAAAIEYVGSNGHAC
jgi:hypothetical protein